MWLPGWKRLGAGSGGKVGRSRSSLGSRSRNFNPRLGINLWPLTGKTNGLDVEAFRNNRSKSAAAGVFSEVRSSENLILRLWMFRTRGVRVVVGKGAWVLCICFEFLLYLPLVSSLYIEPRGRSVGNRRGDGSEVVLFHFVSNRCFWSAFFHLRGYQVDVLRFLLQVLCSRVFHACIKFTCMLFIKRVPNQRLNGALFSMQRASTPLLPVTVNDLKYLTSPRV